MEPTEEPKLLPFPAPVETTFDLACPYCDTSSKWNRLATITRGWQPKCNHLACLFACDGVHREWMSPQYKYVEAQLSEVTAARLTGGVPVHVYQFICNQVDLGDFWVLFVKDPDQFRAWLDSV